jgi:hypothetical protein
VLSKINSGSRRMTEELRSKVEKALRGSGYPLELEVAAAANRKGWVVFHACEYEDPETGKIRELDLLLYKKIHNRRIEIRISCKSSTNKQFVFFTHDRTRYIPMGELKCTPLVADVQWRRSVRKALESLPLFSHPSGAINYTVLSGEKPDRDARTLLREALMSVVTSTHYRLLPNELLDDERGTAYFFTVVLRGSMFEAKYDETSKEIAVADTSYAVWSGKISIPERYWKMKVLDAKGDLVPFADAFYWFGSHLHVEFVRDTSLESYLDTIENAFRNLTPSQQRLFGKDWSDENFPKTVRPMPSLSGKRRK